MAINAARESIVEEIPSYHEAEEDATRAVSVAVTSVDESIEAEPQRRSQDSVGEYQHYNRILQTQLGRLFRQPGISIVTTDRAMRIVMNVCDGS